MFSVFSCKWPCFLLLIWFFCFHRLRKNESLSAALAECESNCVEVFVEVLRFDSFLGKKFLKFVQTRIAACSFVHVSIVLLVLLHHSSMISFSSPVTQNVLGETNCNERCQGQIPNTEFTKICPMGSFLFFIAAKL